MPHRSDHPSPTDARSAAHAARPATPARHRRFLAACAAAAVAVGCSNADPARLGAPADAQRARGVGAEASSRPDLNAVRAELLAADRAHAAATAQGLLAGMPTAWADDVVLLWPTLPVAEGKAQALATLQGLSNAAARTMTWYPVRADASGDGTQGYTYGYGSRTAPGAAGPVTTYVQYIAYWRRDAGGAWRVRAWSFAGAVPPLPAGAPAGCETPDDRHRRVFPHASATAARAELLAADGAFAAQAAAEGAEPAFLAWAAGDAAAVGMAAQIVCGRAAAAALFAGPPGALTWAPAIADAAPSGDLGFTVGVARVAGTPVTYTKYLTIWRRENAGAWRFVVDGGNAAPAPR